MVLTDILVYILKFIVLLIPLLVSIAFLTLLERKIIASMQQRKGPNVVGFLGLMQAVADGLKLVFKETTLPSYSINVIFLIAPAITFTCALASWLVIPFNYWNIFLNLDFGILYIFILSSLSVYGLVFAGWASNSKYALLGGLRASAQMISYEVCFGLIIYNIALFSGSLSLLDIVETQNDIWFIIPLFPVFVLFFTCALAETNRAPFDLPEAEGELVAGYNIEYSGLGFALFFLAEYSNIIFMGVLCTLLFLGGWSLPWVDLGSILDNQINLIIYTFIFTLKVFFFLFLFIWIRAVCPRYRYDQLMNLGWKFFLPIAIYLTIFNLIIVYFIYAI